MKGLPMTGWIVKEDFQPDIIHISEKSKKKLQMVVNCSLDADILTKYYFFLSPSLPQTLV